MSKSQNKKSSAKSHGLKAIIKTPEFVAVSTFGRHNSEAAIEQTINRKTNENTLMSDYLMFNAELFSNKTLSLEANRKLRGETTTPTFEFDVSLDRQDLLGFKEKLTHEMFVRENVRDNIHIQIAYNVLDIKKIIGLHIGDILMSLSKLTSNNESADDELKDVVGLIDFEIPFADINEKYKEHNTDFIKRLYDYSMYFDHAFSGSKDAIADDYDVLRILSLIRQGVVHGGKYSSILYNQFLSPSTEILFRKSQSIFNKDLKYFNNSFKETSKINLMILFETTHDKKIVEKYYDFVLYKYGKNLGISLDVIRDNIINMTFNDFDKSRSKVYFEKLTSIYDYLLFDYYSKNLDRVNELRSQSRASKNEYQKSKAYEFETKKVLRDRRIASKLVKVKKIIWKYIQNAKKYKPYYPKGLSFREDSISYFPSLLYTMAKFLDQKEVSELLTSVINKLENIKSLEEMLISLNEWDNDFKEDYKIFNNNNIQLLIDEFKVAYSLAVNKRRLTKIESKSARINAKLLRDAYNIFKSDNFVTEETIGEFLDLSSEETKTTSNLPKRKLRNILINSIIKNRRFAYLIKYLSPLDCNKLVTNTNILNFVFRKTGQYEFFPENVIETYYRKINKLRDSETVPSKEDMIDFLINQLKSINMDNIQENYKDFKELEKQKQLLNLYLTIAYLVVKGIIHVNSIYLLACNSLERDMYYAFDVSDPETLSFDLLNKYLPLKKCKHQEMIKHNMKEVEDCFALQKGNHTIYRYYRDKIVHLNFIPLSIKYLDRIQTIRSFFDVFNFGVQQWAINDSGKAINRESLLMIKLENDLKTYGTYQRNFLKIINLPFAYNMARFNNLTIEDLFNKNIGSN